LGFDQILPQEDRPIIFTLLSFKGPLSLSAFAGNLALSQLPLFVIFGSPGILKPESISYNRIARGTVSNTIDGAFLDDFGEGLPSVQIQGHTGLKTGGFEAFKLLELMFQSYLFRRQQLLKQEQDPSGVSLWLIDTVNVEAVSIYPMSFTLERSRAHPLLYNYRIQAVVLTDLLEDLESTLSSKLQKSQPPDPGLLNSILGFTASFGLTITSFAN
jgi:hypothetical protein